jgi:two-component system LytT family response regulator
LKTIIVEDEPLSRLFLQSLLNEFCPEIDVVASVSTEDDAVNAITEMMPALVFMDIELQQGSGFDVLKRIAPPYPFIVFTTAFDHYATRTIRFSGIGYLQKPIDIDNLRQVIGHLKEREDAVKWQKAIGHLLYAIQNNYQPSHLSLVIAGDAEHVLINDIVRIEASADTACEVVLRSGEHKLTDTPLREYEVLLKEHSFYRIHPSHLINLAATSGIDGDQVIMADDSMLPVSSRRREELKEQLEMMGPI